MAQVPARASLSERRHAGSRLDILEVARGVLAKLGPHRLTLEAVATELGISKQALYHYFPGKDALLFELVIDALVASAEAVQRACAAAPDGPAALDALIRTYVGYFLPRLDLHRLIAMQTAPDFAVSRAQLERIRPVNDLLYGEAERKLAAEQTGRRRDRKAPRRLAFTAHLAAMGFLTMRAIVELANDPLVHTDDEVVDELCRTFRAAAEKARTP